MKASLLFALCFFVTVGVFGQGTIIFVNNWGTGKAPIYDFDPTSPATQKTGNTANGIPAGVQTYGSALLAGTGYTAELWGRVGTGQPESTLQPLGQTTFRTGSASGFINSVTLSVPNAPLGGATVGGTFQVRAWDNMNGTVTSWAAAVASFTGGTGRSGIVNVPALGGTGTPPTPDPNLIGLQSFSIGVIPEPSFLALGVLGFGTVFFWRSRNFETRSQNGR